MDLSLLEKFYPLQLRHPRQYFEFQHYTYSDYLYHSETGFSDFILSFKNLGRGFRWLNGFLSVSSARSAPVFIILNGIAIQIIRVILK